MATPRGVYDIRLQFIDDGPGAVAVAPPADATTPGIYSAIEEQLGLKLKAAKAPVDVLVIDHIDRPSAN